MSATLVWTLLIVYVLSMVNMSVSDSDRPRYCSYCICAVLPSGGLKVNCARKGLFDRPRKLNNQTTVLDLSNNYIKTVKNTSYIGFHKLRILHLSDNRITTIERGAFRDLISLEYLYLDGQKSRLFILQSVFQPGVFEGLDNLKLLYIHNNVDLLFADVSYVPSEAFKNLKSLSTLRIDGVKNVNFDENFKSLQNLTTLEMSDDLGTCEIGQLDNSSFIGLTSLKRLTMTKCRIKTIHNGTFSWLKNLEYLDLSWNTELEFEQFGRIAEDLKNNTVLKYLNISAIHEPNRSGIDLLSASLRHLRDMKLIEIQMNDNGIEYVDYGVFSLFPSTLKYLYLRRNKLNFGIYLEQAIFNNRNLTIFDAANQQLASRSDRAFSSKFSKVFEGGLINKRSHSKSIGIRIRRSENSKLELRTLICSGSSSDIKLIDFTNTENNITYMDLSGNFLPKVHARAFSGLLALTVLNLSSNYMELVHHTAFHGLWNLEILNLNNNLIGISLSQSSSVFLFESLGNLKEINLSWNRIYNMNKNLFSKLHSLEHIDLSENYLDSLDVSLSRITKLKTINLSSNRLHILSESFRSYLNQLSGHRMLSVNLGQNSFICNCESIPFLEWLLEPSAITFVDRDEYYCTQKSGEEVHPNSSFFEILENLEEDCVSYLEIIVGCSTSTSFILAIILSILIYHNRWRLRYIYYMAKIKLDHEKEGVDELYEFDAFVSYGDGDRIFVVEDMRQNLENVSGKRLNIRDRDFELGEAIAINISRAIRTSKRTFLMVSRYFLKSKWCNFEMNMAMMEEIHQNRKVIVIVFLESIPMEDMPIELLNILKDCPNTDFPKDPHLMDAFWRKCIHFINDR
ncbi:Toll-like receptor [Mactra antiquata]